MSFIEAIWICCYFLTAAVLLLVVVPIIYLLHESFAIRKIEDLTEKAKEVGQQEKQALCAYMRSAAKDRRLQVFGCIAVIEASAERQDLLDWGAAGANIAVLKAIQSFPDNLSVQLHGLYALVSLASGCVENRSQLAELSAEHDELLCGACETILYAMAQFPDAKALQQCAMQAICALANREEYVNNSVCNGRRLIELGALNLIHKAAAYHGRDSESFRAVASAALDTLDLENWLGPEIQTLTPTNRRKEGTAVGFGTKKKTAYSGRKQMVMPTSSKGGLPLAVSGGWFVDGVSLSLTLSGSLAGSLAFVGSYFRGSPGGLPSTSISPGSTSNISSGGGNGGSGGGQVGKHNGGGGSSGGNASSQQTRVGMGRVGDARRPNSSVSAPAFAKASSRKKTPAKNSASNSTRNGASLVAPTAAPAHTADSEQVVAPVCSPSEELVTSFSPGKLERDELDKLYQRIGIEFDEI
jgi:uncharacterized membrane protein YgcG